MIRRCFRDLSKEMAGEPQMKIDVDQALAVAELARLDISSDEARAVAAQLNTLLEHFEKLAELDTDEVPPTSHALPIHAALRSDQVAPSTDGARLLQEAPQSHDGHFAVPKVID
jgi:aspartyl-tRNA(Asn)/glutamyl-tRNA(Gln) amidotransferase subunit C